MDVTIAILAFKNLFSDESLKKIMEGFENELVINLSKFIGLSVVAPESLAQLNYAADPSILSRIGVNYSLSVTYRNVKTELRIGFQLRRVNDFKVIFASNFNEPVDAILDLQDGIIRQIVNSIQQQIDFDLLSFSYKKESIDLAAYENYLLGMKALTKGDLEHDTLARKYFEAALSINASYARAYTGLSLSYFNEWSCQLWDRWDVSKNGAQRFALKALEIDEQDYIALAVAGRTFLFSEEYEKAEHYLRKSVKINPNDANNLVQVAYSMIFLGLAKEAEKLYLRACELNPLHPERYFLYGASIYFELGDYRKALELGKKMDENSAWVDFPVYMAAAYYHLGELDRMGEQWHRYLGLYSKCISKDAEPEDAEALEWQIKINPYKGKTNLKEFWDYVSDRKGSHISKLSPASEPKSPSFLKRGEIWEVSYNGFMVLLKNSKGVNDIFRLLLCPDKEIHCTELVGEGLFREEGVEIVDQRSKTEYKSRLRNIKEDIAEAQELFDSEKIAHLQEEYDQLIDHLSSVVGLSGKSRESSSTVEKARASVTLRIKSSINKIEKVHPQLAKHFSSAIKTGTFCSYRPEFPVNWEI